MTLFLVVIPAWGMGANQLAAVILIPVVVLIAAGFTWSVQISIRNSICGRASAHLGVNCRTGVTATHVIALRDRVNLQRALDNLRSPTLPPVGLTWSGHDLHSLLQTRNIWPVPLKFTSLPVSISETLACADEALYFLQAPDGFAFLARVRNGFQLEVMAANEERAKRAMALMQSEMSRRSAYRGSVISVEYPTNMQTGDDPDYVIHFHDMQPVPREQVVLPDEIMRVLERNVLGLLNHAATLRKAGRSTRHGVLLHGPPGTGKTLVTRYLARACPGHTVVLLTGRQLALIRESCQLARLLAPSVVVLEDVDLIALAREQSIDNRLLHDLMDEMDGLGTKADVIFLLTTNRPRALEAALASRPGRIDQAVYFPLPDRDCRRRLFQLFTAGLDLSGVAIDPLLERTEGASPAFIQEVFRKAALFAAERGEHSDPLTVTDADFDAAVRELIEFGGVLTRNMLGYRSDPDAGGSRVGFRA